MSDVGVKTMFEKYTYIMVRGKMVLLREVHNGTYIGCLEEILMLCEKILLFPRMKHKKENILHLQEKILCCGIKDRDILERRALK